MATKEHRRQAKGLIEALESRMHGGMTIAGNEIHSARDFLRESEFSPASDYFNRLTQIAHRLGTRVQEPAVRVGMPGNDSMEVGAVRRGT